MGDWKRERVKKVLQICYITFFTPLEISRKSLIYMARPEGFEPPTPWFVARYSIQLSYGRVVLSGGERGIRTLDGISPILP